MAYPRPIKSNTRALRSDRCRYDICQVGECQGYAGCPFTPVPKWELGPWVAVALLLAGVSLWVIAGSWLWR